MTLFYSFNFFYLLSSDTNGLTLKFLRIKFSMKSMFCSLNIDRLSFFILMHTFTSPSSFHLSFFFNIYVPDFSTSYILNHTFTDKIPVLYLLRTNVYWVGVYPIMISLSRFHICTISYMFLYSILFQLRFGEYFNCLYFTLDYG